MEHYKITKFNKRRLQRGEPYCYRANIFIDGEIDGWVWLSVKDIKEILDDDKCTIDGHEDYIKD